MRNVMRRLGLFCRRFSFILFTADVPDHGHEHSFCAGEYDEAEAADEED